MDAHHSMIKAVNITHNELVYFLKSVTKYELTDESPFDGLFFYIAK